jgi:hypothetical protein
MSKVENMDRRKTFDLPKLPSNIKRDAINAFKSARETRSILGMSGDPLLTDRPYSSKSGRIATQGYTGYRPQYEDNPFESDGDSNLCLSPINKAEKIRGYTGYVPGSRAAIGTAKPLGNPAFDRSILKSSNSKLLKLQSSNNFAESEIPQCKYKTRPEDLTYEEAAKYIRPGHADFVEQRYGSDANLRKRYADAISRVEKSGQTQRGLLCIIQSKLSERVTSYADQVIRTRNIFDYFDFDSSNTLDETEFQRFLELTNCYLEEPQRIALFAYFDSGFTGGISWTQFQANCTVPNPKGGTAVLPKSITRMYSLGV